MSCEQNAEENHSIQTNNKSLQMRQSSNTSERHLTNNNCMNEEIKSSLTSEGTESFSFPFDTTRVKIQRIIIFLVVINKCKPWPLLNRKNTAEDVRKQSAEEGVGPKREKVNRGWRKLDEEEMHVLHSSSGDQIKVGGECDTCGEEGKCIQYISGKREGKRPLERHKHRRTYYMMW
jgi:hypothetical protein